MAELAVNNREAGMSYKENAEWLREHANNINYWFKVEDLMYLKRGGRVSAATAIMGTALNIKPILTIDKNGKLQTIRSVVTSLHLRPWLRDLTPTMIRLY